ATLVRAKRQRLHARIAAAIEQHVPETVQAQPELLAHHYMKAGLAEPAIDYWLRSGQRAIARSAMAEALTQLRNGVDLIAGLPEDHQEASATVVAHRIGGTGAFGRGEVAAARTHLERTLALNVPERHHSLAFLYVQDPRVAPLSVLSWTLFALGYPEQAQAR